MTTVEDIATQLRDDAADVQLLYAFNSVGKTRLSVAYKNVTKDAVGRHTGIYHNAYSEDLFVWNNDIENGEANIRITVLPSSLSRLHADPHAAQCPGVSASGATAVGAGDPHPRLHAPRRQGRSPAVTGPRPTPGHGPSECGHQCAGRARRDAHDPRGRPLRAPAAIAGHHTRRREPPEPDAARHAQREALAGRRDGATLGRRRGAGSDHRRPPYQRLSGHAPVGGGAQSARRAARAWRIVADGCVVVNRAAAGVSTARGTSPVDGFANWGNPGSTVDYDTSGFIGGALIGKKFKAVACRLGSSSTAWSAKCRRHRAGWIRKDWTRRCNRCVVRLPRRAPGSSSPSAPRRSSLQADWRPLGSSIRLRTSISVQTCRRGWTPTIPFTTARRRSAGWSALVSSLRWPRPGRCDSKDRI